ncbi:trypsin-like peptidase domain-containing protein [Pseudonocardia ailaonensis]|uniref:trypsin-like peptidase domain-containing protein n=1 Tax=Pseudonocardia ailaonensis TaxID=367279 RepID=UPI0031E05818
MGVATPSVDSRTPASGIPAEGPAAVDPTVPTPPAGTPVMEGLPAPDPLSDTGRHALVEPRAAPVIADPVPSRPVEAAPQHAFGGEEASPGGQGLTAGTADPGRSAQHGAGPPAAGSPSAHAPAERSPWGTGLRRSLPLLAAALVIALVAGGVGGWIGHSLATPDRPVPGAVSAPMPAVDPATGPLTPVEAVAAKVLPSVVQLRVEGGGPGEDEGSGIVLSADGLVLTNDHVVAPAATGGTITAELHDGRSLPARIVGRDSGSDLAVVRLDGATGLTAAELGDSASLRVGQQVVAVGAPLGLDGTVTTGIVSALDRAVNVGGPQGGGQSTVLDAVQHDAPINPGNSGGPLVDLQGRVVAVNSAIASTGSAQGGSIGVGFSIPVNQARRVADELARTGRATHAVLGLAPISAGRPASGGAVVGQVTPGGPAAQAGVRPGDVVRALDERLVADGNELIAAVRAHAPGDRVRVTLGDRQVTVVLAGEPS